ncbi:hypothetical protein RirG_129440 [Rhizophagus irregularis DAOM 197198w]|uniref:Uncharacterized protein n=1 Tax=Rhizophagus irregularis (strain DAOM 197198w) TaxID=1432141 RepID=A0A015J8D4_RHIIW|nr:hypothetical protein RirG_129440 [Rhizophagus irregularis DAOM 197198w]
MAQRYAVIQRPDFDQQSVSNGSETNSRGSSTNSSSGSSGLRVQIIILYAVISVDILRLGMGVIGKDTIKAFYRGDNIKGENLEKIDAWIVGLGKFPP